MIREAIEKIADLVRGANAIQVVDSQKLRTVFVKDKDEPMDAHEYPAMPRAGTIESLTDFCLVAKDAAVAPRPEVWHSSQELTLLCDRDDRHERLVMPLQMSERFSLLNRRRAAQHAGLPGVPRGPGIDDLDNNARVSSAPQYRPEVQCYLKRSYLTEVPREEWPDLSKMTVPPSRVWMSGKWMVQLFEEGPGRYPAGVSYAFFVRRFFFVFRMPARIRLRHQTESSSPAAAACSLAHAHSASENRRLRLLVAPPSTDCAGRPAMGASLPILCRQNPSDFLEMLA
jgi:hypothetical protein